MNGHKNERSDPLRSHAEPEDCRAPFLGTSDEDDWSDWDQDWSEPRTSVGVTPLPRDHFPEPTGPVQDVEQMRRAVESLHAAFGDSSGFVGAAVIDRPTGAVLCSAQHQSARASTDAIAAVEGRFLQACFRVAELTGGSESSLQDILVSLESMYLVGTPIGASSRMIVSIYQRERATLALVRRSAQAAATTLETLSI